MLYDNKAQVDITFFSFTVIIVVLIILFTTLPIIGLQLNQTYSTTEKSTPIIIEPSLTPLQIISTPEPQINIGESIKTTALNIHTEKTKVSIGEEILIKLSAVNLITKKTMHIQIILVPPSGMSVSSSNFVFSGAGQYTSDYRIEPGQGRDIEIKLISNQAGNFKIEGRAIYYFGDDIINSEDYILSIPVEVVSIGNQYTAVIPLDTSSEIEQKSDINLLVPIIPLIILVTIIFGFLLTTIRY